MRLIAAALILFSGFAAAAAEDTCSRYIGQQVRPIIAKPLKDAAELQKAGKLEEARQKALEARDVPDKTPYESCIIDQAIASLQKSQGHEG